MSGIGFQKLNGNGTSAYQQLQKTSELIAEMQKLNFPDIYKQARMFVGNNFQLTPVNLSWSANQSGTTNFNGRFFGYFTISLEMAGTGTSNNAYARARLLLYDGNNIQFQSSRIAHGDDILAYSNQIDPNIIGFGTSFVLGSDGSDAYATAIVSFVGFEIGEALPNPVIVIPPAPVLTSKLFFNGNIAGGLSFNVASNDNVLNRTVNQFNKSDFVTVLSTTSEQTFLVTNNLTQNIVYTLNGSDYVIPHSGGTKNIIKSEFIGQNINFAILDASDPFNILVSPISPITIGTIELYDDVNPHLPFAILNNETLLTIYVKPRLGFTTIVMVNNSNKFAEFQLRSDSNSSTGPGLSYVFGKIESDYNPLILRIVN